MEQRLYQALAMHLNARENCTKAKNPEWEMKHGDMVQKLVADHMPRGSGFDCGTSIDFGASKNGDRLVFNTSFHHMNENGMYDRWTHHDVTVRPSLQFGFNLTVSGKDHNQIKEYIAEMFDSALRTVL